MFEKKSTIEATNTSDSLAATEERPERRAASSDGSDGIRVTNTHVAMRNSSRASKSDEVDPIRVTNTHI